MSELCLKKRTQTKFKAVIKSSTETVQLSVKALPKKMKKKVIEKKTDESVKWLYKKTRKSRIRLLPKKIYKDQLR